MEERQRWPFRYLTLAIRSVRDLLPRAELLRRDLVALDRKVGFLFEVDRIIGSFSTPEDRVGWPCSRLETVRR